MIIFFGFPLKSCLLQLFQELYNAYKTHRVCRKVFVEAGITHTVRPDIIKKLVQAIQPLWTSQWQRKRTSIAKLDS